MRRMLTLVGLVLGLAHMLGLVHNFLSFLRTLNG